MPAAWQSFAHRSDNLGTDLVVTKPTGTVDGDLLIAVGITAAAQTITKPDGSWTTHASSIGGTAPLFYKVASSEPASWTFVVSGTPSACLVVVRVSGQHASSPIDAAAGLVDTATALVIPSVTSAGADRLLLQIVAKQNATSYTAPGTAAERWDGQAAAQNQTTAGGDEVVGSGATGTRTWTAAAGTGRGVGYMLAIAPIPPIPGDVAGTTPVATASLAGSLDGLLAGTTPVGTVALAGSLDGLIAAQAPATVAALVGELPGDLGPSSPRTTAALDGTYTPPDHGSGDIAAPTPSTVADLAGDYADPPGDLASTTPAVVGAFAGSLVSQFAVATAIPTAALTGSFVAPIVGTLAGTTPAVTARLRERGPAHHRATVREVVRTHAIAEVGQKHTITDKSRKTTILEGIA